MGQMRFLVPRPERISEALLQRAYLAGMDCIPWLSETHWDGSELIVVREIRESGNLYVPWPVVGQGELILCTASLMERKQPYHLPVELARGLKQLQALFDYDQAELARRLGMERTSLVHHLRILQLSDPVLELVQRGALDFGHAKALLAAAPGQRERLAHLAVTYGWSVARLTRETKAPQTNVPAKVDRDLARALDELSQCLGAPMRLRQASDGAGGTLELRYYSTEELDGVLQHLRAALLVPAL